MSQAVNQANPRQQLRRTSRRYNAGGTGKRTNIGEKLKTLDMFQTPFRFNLPNGSPTYPSGQGLVFSALLIVTLIIYALVQMLTLMQYSNSIITVNVIDSALTEEYSFDLDYE